MSSNDDIIDRICKGEFKNIIVLTGAGISVNAGIPDYRSHSEFSRELAHAFPNLRLTQLFSRNHIEEVRKHPLYDRFVTQVKNAQPTPAHKLCVELHEKGFLRRVYTQNIDGLHTKAGLPSDKVVEFHGNIDQDIVLYGDNISPQALHQAKEDLVENNQMIDLLLVMGTSLQVAPFCALPNLPPKCCPRILVDKCPSNAYTNDWSKIKGEPQGLYSSYHGLISSWKLGNRMVTLKPKWKTTEWEKYIFESDTDIWAQKVLSCL